MGIYINGREMPKEDEEIIIRIDSSGTVMTEYALQMDGCKAVSVPPHGRLIDADALRLSFEKQISEQDMIMELCKTTGDTKNYFNVSKLKTGMVSLLRELNNAPIIVSADKEEWANERLNQQARGD